MTTIGNRFKTIRTSLHILQDEMGAQIGLSKQGVSNIEKDKSFMSPIVLSKLAIDLKVNLNYLIAGVGSMFIQSDDEIIKKVANDDDLDKKVRALVTQQLAEFGLTDVVK